MIFVIDVVTPGEEYFRIFPLEKHSFPSKGSLFVRAFYEVFLPIILKTHLPSLLGLKVTSRMQNIMYKFIECAHKSLFLLQGRYPTIAHRLSGQTYAALRRPLNADEGNELVRNIGLVSFLASVLNLYWEYKEHSLTQQVSQDNDYQSEETEAQSNYRILQSQDTEKKSRYFENEQEFVGSTRYKCILCLDVAQEQVVTECGHVFCWKCIVGWVEEGKVIMVN